MKKGRKPMNNNNIYEIPSGTLAAMGGVWLRLKDFDKKSNTTQFTDAYREAACAHMWHHANDPMQPTAEEFTDACRYAYAAIMPKVGGRI